MSALSWPVVEAAWVAMVRAALGGSDDLKIIWAHHRNPAPEEAPVVVLKIEDYEGVDRGDALEYFDAEGALNEEIERETTRFWLCTLSIEIRVTTKDATGAGSPHALATHLLTFYRLEEQQAALEAAGVGVVGDGKGVSGAELVNGVWQPTTKVPVQFYAATSASEFLGYIASYEGTEQSPPAPAAPFVSTPEADIAAEVP